MVRITIDNGDRAVSVEKEDMDINSTWIELTDLFAGALSGLGYSLGDFELAETVKHEHDMYIEEKYHGRKTYS